MQKCRNRNPNLFQHPHQRVLAILAIVGGGGGGGGGARATSNSAPSILTKYEGASIFIFCNFTHILAWDNTTKCPHVYFQNYIFNVAQGETKIR